MKEPVWVRRDVVIAYHELNGFHFGASEVEVVLNTLALAAGEMSEVDYATWLELEANSKSA